MKPKIFFKKIGTIKSQEPITRAKCRTEIRAVNRHLAAERNSK